MESPEKTIVVSDIHISNGAGYSWFLPPCPSEFTAMLKRMAGDPTVKELVLLGDLFDLWLYPLDVVPWTTPQILAGNPEVVEALQACVAKLPNVYYILGNHDMEVASADLKPLDSGGRSVQLVDSDWYNRQYQNVRHLEHGHFVDMFNAPDSASDTIGGYPLGYFITRLVATADNQNALWNALQGVVQYFDNLHRATGIKAAALPSMGSLFIELIVTALEVAAGVNDHTPIRMPQADLDGKYTVGDIKTNYASLLPTWEARYPNSEDLLNSMLTGLLANGLDWYAKLLSAQFSEIKVTIMGHTHHGEVMGHYDNSGCWCIPSAFGHSDATPTYISIVGETATLVPWTQ
jgi:UDP-2,3-diacylglucosamine pyrophosphatase LpxH